MGILSKLNPARLFQKAEMSLLFEQRKGHAANQPQNYRKIVKEAYAGNAFVFRAVNLIGMGASLVKIILEEVQASGEVREIAVHPVLDLLREPNPLQSGANFTEAVFGYRETTGNSYVAIVGPDNGPPKELWPLSPSAVKVIPGPASEPVLGYEYRVRGAVQTIPPEAMIHWKTWNPFDQLYGMSRVTAAALDVDYLNEALRWNASLLRNGARPSGTWKSKAKRPPDREVDKMKEKMRQDWQSFLNAGTPFLAWGDAEWIEHGMTPQDVDWITGQNLSARKVGIVFNVPPEMLGDPQSKQFANHKEARKALYEDNILPQADQWIGELNQNLVPLFARPGQRLRLRAERSSIPALREDQDSLFKRAEESSFLAINEKRAMTGYDDWPGGDVVLVPLNLFPLGSGSEDKQQAQAVVAINRKGELWVLNDRPGLPPSVTKQAAEDVLTPLALPGNDAKELYRKTLDARREKLVKASVRHVAGEFDRERQAVKAAIRGAQSAQDIVERAAGAIEAGAEQWVQALTGKVYLPVGDLLAGAVFRGLESEARSKQIETRQAYDDARQVWLSAIGDYSTEVVGTHVSQITSTTRGQIQSAVYQGITDGQSIPQIRSSIDQLYLDQIIPNRSTVIARTETIGASNFGSQAGARATGLPLEKEWIPTPDDRTRDTPFDHRVRPVVKLDEPYTISGENLMFPGDSSMGASPGNIIQCRCTEGYNVEG